MFYKFKFGLLEEDSCIGHFDLGSELEYHSLAQVCSNIFATESAGAGFGVSFGIGIVIFSFGGYQS